MRAWECRELVFDAEGLQIVVQLEVRGKERVIIAAVEAQRRKRVEVNARPVQQVRLLRVKQLFVHGMVNELVELVDFGD